jgi:hypothetical protein
MELCQKLSSIIFVTYSHYEDFICILKLNLFMKLIFTILCTKLKFFKIVQRYLKKLMYVIYIVITSL